jgi:hypothetical protein
MAFAPNGPNRVPSSSSSRRWRPIVQRSSESIGTIAAALAKAQAQLVNPEKSLVAIVRSDGRLGAEQTFRYAPLSSGLDIVRKALSQHEIATVQTTSIDEAAGVVRLSQFWRMPPENGLPPIGRSVQLRRLKDRSGWVQP